MTLCLTASRSAADILRNYRIVTASSAPGRYYAICPQCSHKRKAANQKFKCLGVTIDGEGVKFGCNHCSWIGGEYYRGAERPGRIRTLSPPTPRATFETSEPARVAQAVRMWSCGTDPRGTLAERYLSSRGLELTDDIAGRVVRFAAASPWKNDSDETEYRSVMLTVFRSIADNMPMAVQRTLLSDDGRKLDRRMLGPAGAAAIKIDDDADIGQGLHVGEGFETCLAGRQLGFRPVWALGSAGAIGKFPVLGGIDELTVFGETDDSGDNLANAKACARRWTEAGREAWLLRPNIAGDLNDVVMKS
jgi:Toprim domain